MPAFVLAIVNKNFYFISQNIEDCDFHIPVFRYIITNLSRRIERIRVILVQGIPWRNSTGCSLYAYYIIRVYIYIINLTAIAELPELKAYDVRYEALLLAK